MVLHDVDVVVDELAGSGGVVVLQKEEKGLVLEEQFLLDGGVGFRLAEVFDLVEQVVADALRGLEKWGLVAGNEGK